MPDKPSPSKHYEKRLTLYPMTLDEVIEKIGHYKPPPKQVKQAAPKTDKRKS